MLLKVTNNLKIISVGHFKTLSVSYNYLSIFLYILMLKHTYTTCFILPDVQEKENNEIKHKNYGLPHSFEFYFFFVQYKF